MPVACSKSPIAINVNNGICNLRCSYCSLKSENTGGSLPTALQVKELIARLTKTETIRPAIRIFGYEPMLNREAILVLEKFRKLGKIGECIISTNGTANQKLLLKLARAGWIISLSFDGIWQKDRPFQNGDDSTKAVEQAIKKLVEQKSRFQIRMTVKSWDDFEKSIDYVTSKGCQIIEVSPILPLGFGEKSKTVGSPDILEKVMRKYISKGIAVYPSFLGKGYCSMAGDHGSYYIFEKATGKWIESCCYSKIVKWTPKIGRKAKKDQCIHFNVLDTWGFKCKKDFC